MHPEALYSFITMCRRSSSWEALVKIEMATNIFSLSKKVTLCEKFYLQLLDSLSSSSSFSVYLGKAKTISRKTFWIETFPCYTFSSLYFHFSFQFFSENHLKWNINKLPINDCFSFFRCTKWFYLLSKTQSLRKNLLRDVFLIFSFLLVL